MQLITLHSASLHWGTACWQPECCGSSWLRRCSLSVPLVHAGLQSLGRPQRECVRERNRLLSWNQAQIEAPEHVQQHDP